MDAEATAPARESDLIALAADIVSAFVSNNSVATGDLPNLINDVHSALKRVGAPAAPERDKPEPAVPIKKSVTPDYIVSLFDGRKYKSLKRHIRTAHDMTPQQYREFWKLAPDYPMVARDYAEKRSDLAKKTGLGRMPGQKRGRRKKSSN